MLIEDKASIWSRSKLLAFDDDGGSNEKANDVRRCLSASGNDRLCCRSQSCGTEATGAGTVQAIAFDCSGGEGQQDHGGKDRARQGALL
ncbi:hypothetical protein D3C87_2053750 [compost metagenome]